MAKGNLSIDPRHLETLFRVGTVGGLTDAELLERFRACRDEGAEVAFAVLVERHGPMVLRTCRAVLRNDHDAHDAFQATFLVLVRRAGSLWVTDSLGSWLHQVALRTAACSKAAGDRRRRHEGRAAALTPRSTSEGGHDDFGGVVHEEVGRLPAQYRAAVVLCLLEGLSPEQAARNLGWPVGTVHSRLARGRERLRSRLTRRGLAGVLLPTKAVPVALPSALADSTARAAFGFATCRGMAGGCPASGVVLAERVLKTMFLTNLKLTAVALLAGGIVASGVGTWAQQPKGMGEESSSVAPTAIKAKSVAKDNAPPTEDAAKAKTDRDRIQGTWRITECHVGGQDVTRSDSWELVTFEGDTMFIITREGKRYPEGSTFKLDPTEMPRTFDFTGGKGEAKREFKGIYEFDGQHLRICYHQNQRPTKFDPKQQKDAPFNVLFELDRK